MWIFYTALSLFILFTAYFFVFPLSKKRPVLIKRVGLIVYSLILTSALSPLLGWWSYPTTIVVILFWYFMNAWFVFGVTTDMLSEALQKAAAITRSPIDKQGSSYRIDSSIKISYRSFGSRVNFILFKAISKSKKAELARVVFKKFVQNYFI